MNIWVDIANAPQVLYMQPLIKEMQKRGHNLVTTTRNQSEAIELANLHKLNHTAIGKHGGRTLIGKGIAILYRALKLVRLLKRRNIKLAISGSSYSQALAAKWMNIPLISLVDYEGNPGLHIVGRVAKKILIPDLFFLPNLYKYGATKEKIISYRGLKEHIYLSDFTPDDRFLDSVGIPAEKIIVTMRPASTVSAYHAFENPLFDEALRYIASHANTLIILLPRNSEQKEKYMAFKFRNIFFSQHVLDGPNLVYHSDLVVGAGGTMNREAVVLGCPVYSLFMGAMGSIDKHLIEAGKMSWIKNCEDIKKIKIEKRDKLPSTPKITSENLASEIIDMILPL